MKINVSFLLKTLEHEEVDIPKDYEGNLIAWQAEAKHQLEEKYPDKQIELTAFDIGGVFIGLADN